MKLVIIYGPPATGKLTIAKELAKQPGYKVFDNHQTMDFLNSVILDKTKAFNSKVSGDFFELYRKVRIETLRTACKLKDVKGIIITEAYTGKKRFIGSMIRIAEKNKCRVYLVKLSCDLKKLEKRVYSKSRKKYRKIKDKKGLYDFFKRFEGRSDLVYPYKRTLILDTGKYSVKESVIEIRRFLK